MHDPKKCCGYNVQVKPLQQHQQQYPGLLQAGRGKALAPHTIAQLPLRVSLTRLVSYCGYNTEPCFWQGLQNMSTMFY